MAPLIVNLDSAFDWTVEVRQIWERLDWDGIRQHITPQVSSESWLRRSNEIGLVGLVSSVVIDDSYRLLQLLRVAAHSALTLLGVRVRSKGIAATEGYEHVYCRQKEHFDGNSNRLSSR